eukprot:5290796-Amphidinium_carterae.1
MALMVEMPRAVRFAQQVPLDRGPLWALAYETVVDVVRALPSRIAKARRLAHLDVIPFPPVPDDEAAPEVVTEYHARQETRMAIRSEKPQEEEQMRNAFVDSFVTDRFGPAVGKFEAVAREVSLLSRFHKSASLPMADRMRACLKKQGLEGIELSSCVVVYEMDVAFLEPVISKQQQDSATAAQNAPPPQQPVAKGVAGASAAVPPIAQPSPEPAAEVGVRLEIDDVLYEQAKQRLQGLVPILEMGPLAVLVTAHLGQPQPLAAAQGEDEDCS